jgi:hypothetical protein
MAIVQMRIECVDGGGKCLATKLQPGNVPGVENWDELLLAEGYIMRRLFWGTRQKISAFLTLS